MSRFHTPVPVDVSAIKDLLPKRGLHIHGILVEHDAEHKDVKLVIDWESGELKTPYTFPVVFSAEDLRGKKLPNGVTFVEKAAAPKVEGSKVEEPKAKALEVEGAKAKRRKAKIPALAT